MTNYHANSNLVNPPDHSKMTNKGESDYSQHFSTGPAPGWQAAYWKNRRGTSVMSTHPHLTVVYNQFVTLKVYGTVTMSRYIQTVIMMEQSLWWKKKTGAGGYAQISDCCVTYLRCYSIAGHSLGALMYLKTCYIRIQHLSSFIQLLQKVQVSGWCFGFSIPAGICKIKVTAFGCFYH